MTGRHRTVGGLAAWRVTNALLVATIAGLLLALVELAGTAR